MICTKNPGRPHSATYYNTASLSGNITGKMNRIKAPRSKLLGIFFRKEDDFIKCAR
jgi:hypothetical protein